MPDLLLPTWVAFGWLVGGLLGVVAKHLTAEEAASGEPPLATRHSPLATLTSATRHSPLATLTSPLATLAPDPPLQVATAAAFGLFAFSAGSTALSLSLAVHSLYAAVLLALLFVDWRTRYVYHVMVYPPLLAAVLLTPLVSGGAFWQGLAGAAVGGAVFGLIYLVGRLLYRGAVPMGAGDVTLAALMGAMLGLERVVAGLVLAVLVGAVLGLGFALRYRSVKVTMPYGPSLCLSTLALLAIGGWRGG